MKELLTDTCTFVCVCVCIFSFTTSSTTYTLGFEETNEQTLTSDIPYKCHL